MIFAAALSLVLVAGSRAQSVSTSASASDVATVEAQYEASGFDAALPNSQSFDIPLEAQGLLNVLYGSQLISNGKDYAKTAVAALPTLSITPLSNATSMFNTSAVFTIMLADASAVGGPDTAGDYRHYLINGATVAAASGSSNSTQAINLSSGTTITYYSGPGPLTGSGIHRYAWLMFAQPADFQAPDGLAQAGVSPSHWSVSDYVDASGLGDLVAASFFTVTADGTASFTAGSTSAVASASSSAASAGVTNAVKTQSSSGASMIEMSVTALFAGALAVLAMI